MRLGMAATLAATLCAAGFGVRQAQAQDAAPETPVVESAAAADAGTAETETADGATTAPESGPAPEAMLAEARSNALAESMTPGVTDDPLLAKVADYVQLQRDLAAILAKDIVEPADLDGVMDTLSGYDSATLSEAFVSFAAFMAAQDPDFVKSVRDSAEYYGVDQLVQGMLNQPEYALSFPGAHEAAALALTVTRQDAQTMQGMSDRFKQAAYDLQLEGWRNIRADDRTSRLASLSGARRVLPPAPDVLAQLAYGAPVAQAPDAPLRRAAFWAALEYRPDPQTAMTPAPDSTAKTVGVIMSLAALRTLNVSQSRPDLISHFLELPRAKACLDFALLHMRQCVAAGHFKYEDAYCVGEHQLEDMGECLGDIVSPVAPRTPAPPAPLTQAAVDADTTDHAMETSAN